LVADVQQQIRGFAIMDFSQEEARLNLLAVAPGYRRSGIGRRLVEWLQKSALVAGISVIYLEVRASNRGAHAFYEKLGYRKIARLSGYYGRESAIQMARDLWCAAPSDTT
jgi:ribosomal-protein-alanine N-acetyltransferase